VIIALKIARGKLMVCNESLPRSVLAFIVFLFFIITIEAKKIFSWRRDLHQQLFSTMGAAYLKGFLGGFLFGIPPVKISSYSRHYFPPSLWHYWDAKAQVWE
jgi:hypothetical protein